VKDNLFVVSQFIIPQHLLSRLVGWFASTKIEFIKNIFIKNFAKKFDVNMAEAKIEDLEEFASFNDFFTRE
jgi:phosphatidylserine decarboxylase